MSDVSLRLTGLGAMLPPTAWQAVLATGSARRYSTNEVVARQGEQGNCVIALISGHVKVTRLEPDGRELLLAVRGPGEVIGVLAFTGGSQRSATVTALATCHTFTLPNVRFQRIVDEFDLLPLILRHLADRFREGEGIRAEMAEVPALRRVVHALLRLSTAGSDLGDLGLSQQDLAQAVGMSRSAIAAELSRLRRRGLVVTGRRRLAITDRAALASLVAEPGELACDE